MQGCHWDTRGRGCAGWNVGKSIGQRDWSRRHHDKFYRKSQSKVSFFSQDSKETCSLIFVSVIKKVYQENIPFVKPIHIMYVFIKGIIEKTNCYWQVRYFFDLYSVGKYKKQNNISAISAIYPLYHTISATHKKREEKNYLKKWIVARRPQLNYQEK